MSRQLKKQSKKFGKNEQSYAKTIIRQKTKTIPEDQNEEEEIETKNQKINGPNNQTSGRSRSTQIKVK